MKDDFENVEIDNSDDFAEELTKSSVPSSDFNESGTSGIEESGSSFASETNSDVPNVSDADIERLNDSKNKNYTKADSGKEAFDRKVNNKNYYKDALNNAKDRKETAKNNLKKASDNKDKTKDRLNQARQRRNSIPRGQRTSSDKEEYKNAKSEAKEAKANEKKEKNNLKDAKKDNLKSKAYQAKHPIEAAKNTAEAAVKTAAKKVAKKILLAIAPYAAGLILGLALAFFVIELILGPLMEVWGNIDEAITKTADFSEKVTNFYNGYGFQDSKEAFYDELDDLCDRYGCSNDGTGMDVPLILATLFYTEGMGYDTEYGEIEGADAIDGSMNSESTNSGTFAAVRSYAKSKFDEAQQTVDSNGLVYNSGKIYRLRKLARNQFHTDAFGLATRSGEPKKATLTEFLSEYGKTIGSDMLDVLERFAGAAFNAIMAPFKELWAFVLGSDYSGSFFEESGEATEEFGHSVLQVIGDIFYGIADITDVKLGVGHIYVYYYDSYEFEEDNYKNYLMKYYFEYIPEFRSMLGGLTGEAREQKKKYIYEDIVSNKNLFKDIFLQYIDSDSEGYADSCLGAIDANLVSELQKPVNIPDGTTVSFGENNSFGVTSVGFHGGVDLNSSTAGVSAGTDVFAIANGVVDSVGTSGSSNQSSSSISNYLFIGDSRYVGIKSNLEGLGQNNTVAAVTSSTPAQWESVASNGSGTVLGTKITLPSTANGISVMLGVNNVSQTSNMQNMLNSLHTRYPSAQIYVNSVYHVGTKYRGSVTNAMIDSFNQTMSSWCSSNSWATYVDVTNGLNESNGYIKSSYTNDGLHLNSSGQAILVNNIKNAIGGSVNDTYGSWVKIKHNIVIGNNEYNFYSVYNNLGSVTLRQGDNISKGTKIGVIGASSNPGLHFEFHNEQDSAIDPTNLFIQCSSGGVLVGNTNEEQIWNYLLGLGYSKAGVSGVMGNWMQESGFLPNNLENGANSKSGLSDEEFTSEVDNGNISKSEFITSSRFSIYSGGRYGYGLAQWTDPGRKTNFYEFWKSQNTSSIADLKMQLDFYKKEADGYDGLNDSLKNATSPEEAASIFVNIYEVGTAGEARRQNARNIYNKYANQ
jgi:murein DD-endopeptidase MepM/ murein hydrolase activator NlpD